MTNAGAIDLDEGDLAAHTIGIAGVFNNISGTLVTSGAGPDFIYFDFNGTGTMSILGSATFYRLFHSGSGDLVSGNSPITVTNRLDLQSSAGGFTLGSGGIILEGSTFNINGTSFDATTDTSTIIFQGSTSKTVTVDGNNISILDLYKCIVKDADVTLLASNANVNFRFNNRLTLTGRKFVFSASGQTESISYASGATLEYNGTSTQTTDVEWTSLITNLANLKINNPTTVQIAGTGTAGNRIITGNLTLTQGILIHSEAGRTLTVGGNIIGGNATYGVSTRGTLLLNGSDPSDITIAQSFTVGNLTISKNSSTTAVTVLSGGILKLDKGSGSANSTFNITQGTFVFNESTH